MQRLLSSIAPFALAVASVACGGGGGNSPTPEPPAPGLLGELEYFGWTISSASPLTSRTDKLLFDSPSEATFRLHGSSRTASGLSVYSLLPEGQCAREDLCQGTSHDFKITIDNPSAGYLRSASAPASRNIYFGPKRVTSDQNVRITIETAGYPTVEKVITVKPF